VTVDQFRFPGSETPIDPTPTTGAASCCSAEKQTSCCDSSEKSTCCGSEATASGGCGCQ
jgi:hypothetical protein